VKLVSLVVALGVLAAVPAETAAQSVAGSRVLVMPFSTEVEAQAPGGAGASLWLGEAAAVLLGEELASQGVGALTREERVEAFDRLRLPMSSALTRATMIRVAELSGASDLVFGEVSLGEQLRVRVRVVRLASLGERPSVEDVAPLAEIFGLFDRVGQRVADVTSRVRAARPETVAPLTLEAFEGYIKGLVAATPAAQQRFLEGAMRLSPTDARILLALWSVYTSQDQHDKALASANAVSAGSPFARKARYAVAQSLIALRRFDGASRELSELQAREPAPAVSNALGVVELRRGAAASSSPPAVHFSRAVRDEPDNTAYLFNLGYAHALAGNAAEALTWLREAVRLDPVDGDPHLVMSMLLGRSPEGQRELELARALGTSVEPGAFSPGGPVPAGLERIDLELNVSPAVRRAQPVQAQRDQQETAAFHLTRARALVEQRRDREAIEALRRAVYLSPYDDEPHLLLGTLYRRAGRLAEAVDEFKVAIWSRETAAAQIALGSALLEAGDREGARRAAERAIVLAPTSDEARALLNRVGG
jgi:tetratricopeptide (TPR) repeat protein